jgi:hypothetical protein
MFGIAESSTRLNVSIRNEMEKSFRFIQAWVKQVAFHEFCKPAYAFLAFVLSLSARFLIVAGPEKVVPGEREVVMIRLLPEVLDVPIVAISPRPALAIGATTTLHFEQSLSDLLSFLSAESAVSPARIPIAEAFRGWHGISVKAVHAFTC